MEHNINSLILNSEVLITECAELDWFNITATALIVPSNRQKLARYVLKDSVLVFYVRVI